MGQITVPAGTIYPHSVVEQNGVTYVLCRLNAGGARRLGISGDTTGFVGAEPSGAAQLYPCSAENAAALRERLPWLRPVALGVQTSFGFGDRMGSATPGH